jgi:hypothetical protein
MILLAHGPTQLCMSRANQSRCRADIGDSTIRSVSATRPGAERGTVNGMLPDFRFVLGAILAIALLAVAGLGLVTSVKLAQEARMNPIEDARSLAFAGHAQWNQFYDPDGARRFEGLGGKAPAIEARLEAPAEISEIAPPVAAPALVPAVVPQEQTASISAHQSDPDIGAVDAPSIADDKPPASDPPRTDPPQLPETEAAVTIAVPPTEVVGALAPEAQAPGAQAPPGAGAPSAERVASAPAMVPGLGLRQEPLAEPPAEQRPEVQAPAETEATVDPLQNPPTPRVRPKPLFHRRIVRAHIHRVAPVSQQTTQNLGFLPSPPWPDYDNQFAGATTTKKNAGQLTGTLTNRPQ